MDIQIQFDDNQIYHDSGWCDDKLHLEVGYYDDYHDCEDEVCIYLTKEDAAQISEKFNIASDLLQEIAELKAWRDKALEAYPNIDIKSLA